MTPDEMRARLERMRDEAKNAAEIHGASIRDSNTPDLNNWYKAQAEGKDKDREALDWVLGLSVNNSGPKPRKKTIPVIIQANESLSEPIDIRGYEICGVLVDGYWTTAQVSMEVRREGSDTWYPVYLTEGSEFLIWLIPGRVQTWMGGIIGTEIRVRSGSHCTPVAQADTRTLYLQVRPLVRE